MTKACCLLLALLLSSAALFAQATAPAAPAAASAVPAQSGGMVLFNGWYLPRYQPRSGEADTTGALLSLFRKRRQAGLLFTLPFIAGMSLALPISHTDQFGYGQTTVADEAISPPLGVAVLAGTFVGFVLHASKFNQAHLLAVDEAYAAGQPIPARYRRLLNAGHFAEAAFLRQSYSQQMMWDQPPPRKTR